MSEREEKRGGVGCFIMGMSAFMLLPLYVFSIEPAAWLAGQYPAIQDFAQLVYLPLGIAGEAFPPLGDALEWYLDFWQ